MNKSENIKELKRYKPAIVSSGTVGMIESPDGCYYRTDMVDPIILGLEEENDELVTLLPIDSFGIPLTSEYFRKLSMNINSWFVSRVYFHLRGGDCIDLKGFPFDCITSDSWNTIYSMLVSVLSRKHYRNGPCDVTFGRMGLIIKYIPDYILTDDKRYKLLDTNFAYCRYFPERLYTQTIVNCLVKKSYITLPFVPQKFITKTLLRYCIKAQGEYMVAAELGNIRRWSVKLSKNVSAVFSKDTIKDMLDSHISPEYL